MLCQSASAAKESTILELFWYRALHIKGGHWEQQNTLNSFIHPLINLSEHGGSSSHHACVWKSTCGSWLSPPSFIWVLRVDHRSPGLVASTITMLSHLTSPRAGISKIFKRVLNKQKHFQIKLKYELQWKAEARLGLYKHVWNWQELEVCLSQG